MAVSSEERIYRAARGKAAENYGRGWDRIGECAQRAAVAEQVFYMIAAQDESIGGDVVMRIVHHAQSRMADDF